MKRYGVIIFGAALVIGVLASTLSSLGGVDGKLFNFSFGFAKIQGSGNRVVDTRNVSAFNGVDANSSFEVEVTSGSDFLVEVEADDNLIKYIATRVRHGVLHIEAEKRLSSNGPLLVKVSMPNLEKVETSGAASVTVNGIRNAAVSVDSSGASRVRLSGETVRLEADLSGASELDAAGLAAEDATAEASGASKASVNVTGSLQAQASGAGKVVYHGTPAQLSKKTSGAGSVLSR